LFSRTALAFTNVSMDVAMDTEMGDGAVATATGISAAAQALQSDGGDGGKMELDDDEVGAAKPEFPALSAAQMSVRL